MYSVIYTRAHIHVTMTLWGQNQTQIYYRASLTNTHTSIAIIMGTEVTCALWGLHILMIKMSTILCYQFICIWMVSSGYKHRCVFLIIFLFYFSQPLLKSPSTDLSISIHRAVKMTSSYGITLDIRKAQMESWRMTEPQSVKSAFGKWSNPRQAGRQPPTCWGTFGKNTSRCITKCRWTCCLVRSSSL